jgi:nicotinate phosphoribosyltransferase
MSALLNYKHYTDKYFLRTNEILKREGLNPIVGMKVFTRGEGSIVNLNEAVEFVKANAKGASVWVTNRHTYRTKEPLMIIRGPIQSFIELETVYLGILSYELSRTAGILPPNAYQIGSKMSRLKNIYGKKPILYFGARHYHWQFDKGIAKVALKNGAVQTSTDIGSANIGKQGVGTTPHVLTIVLAHKYGRENATLKTAELFDKHMAKEIPKVTLVDTFNKEITDSLKVAEYFGERKNSLRIDTCGENVGEDGSSYDGEKEKDPGFKIGTGVTIELVANVRKALIEAGYGDSTDIVLSSGFGNEDKARIFTKADKDFKEMTGYDLFSSVGIGEVSEARFCTADIFEVEGEPFSKTGREISKEEIDICYETMRKVV